MIKNRHIKHYLTLLVVFSLTAFIAVSCSDNPANGNGDKYMHPCKNLNPGVKCVENLDATTEGNRGKAGKYTFYSLENNAIVLNSTTDNRKDSLTTKWDIAFSGRTIIVNGGKIGIGKGGAQIIDKSFSKVQTPPTKGFDETTIKYPEWANYTGRKDPKHAFLPKDNTTIVVRTADGDHVVKIKIFSWYKGSPHPNNKSFQDPYSRDAGYFTFIYKMMK